MPSPILSVCILTYNRSALLREALDSILPQAENCEGVEVLVSDNASTDNTGEVVQEYCARYPCLRYWRNPVNVLLDGNVEVLIRNAAGEYLHFFSDDDIMPPDFIERLVEDLREAKPAVVYVNHTPFFNDDPKQLGAPTQPVLKRLFTNSTEFFLYTGLGFLSALTVRADEARTHLDKIAHGKWSAHMDIGARAALASKAPSLFDGTLTVLARYEINSRYDVLSHGPMNVTHIHMRLRDEGLLRQEDVDWFNRKAIKLFLPRCIVNNRLNARNVVPARDLRKLYGGYLSFYKLAYPLALIPRPLLRLLALPMRAIIRKRRERRLKSGEIGRQALHLSPPSK